MTAPIGSQIPDAPATARQSSVRNTPAAGKDTAFGDLVRGDDRHDPRPERSRNPETRTAPDDDAGPGDARTGSQGQAATLGDVRVTGTGLHMGETASDRQTENDDDSDDAPKDDGGSKAQPSRDQIPLLLALNHFGRQGAADAPAAGASGNKASGSREIGPGVDADGAAPEKSSDKIQSARTGEHPSNTAASSALLSVGATQPRSDGGRVDNGKPRSPASVQQAGSTGALENEAVAAAAAADEPDGIDAVRTARSLSNGRENTPDSDRATGNRSHGHQDGPVTLASDRSFPAPAAHPLSPTTAGLIEALAARGQATPAPLALHQQPATVAVPTHIMKIELHPAELGVVVANLRMSAGQLTVELKPETAEAYRHLSSDSDTIATSLKKLGLDVGSVTVLQPSVATTPVTRTDAGNQTPSMPGRDASQFQSGTSAGGGDNGGGQQSGRNRNHDGQTLDRPASAHRERPGGSLFI